MHISLTPGLENRVKQKMASGYYNNASEVIRDALRFWETNEALVQHMKLEALKKRLTIGAEQTKQTENYLQKIKDQCTRFAENPNLGRRRPEISHRHFAWPDGHQENLARAGENAGYPGFFGAGDPIRTDDLLITSELLYQLSYAGF